MIPSSRVRRKDVVVHSTALSGWPPDTILIVDLSASGVPRRVSLPVWAEEVWDRWVQNQDLEKWWTGMMSVFYSNIWENIVTGDWDT